MTLPTSFTLATDPGHGWMIVSRSHMAALGLTENDITPYSYQNGAQIALEEDCDAGTFIEAYKAKMGRAPDMKERHANNRSSVRNWNSYGTKRPSW